MSEQLGATWVDGTLVDTRARTVAVDDHGLIVGDGIFETLLARDRRPCFWARHMARLARSFEATGITPVVESTLRGAVESVIGAAGLDDARLRLTITSGSAPPGLRRGSNPTVIVTASSLGEDLGPARVARVPWARNERSILVGVKSTSYAEAAAIQARLSALGADDALLPDTTGRLSETLTANVFAELDGELVTPGLSAGCLPGIVREVLLEEGVAVERDIDIDALDHATELFLTSSVVGVRPIASLDGVSLPVVNGLGTRRARAVFQAAEAADAASHAWSHAD